MSPVTLVPIVTGLSAPIGIDYHEPTGKLVMSVNYPTGQPHNFVLVADDGTLTQFSAASGFTEEIKVATVRGGSHQGGFAVGEVFSGTGVPGAVARISPDGSTVQNPWVALPHETGLLRGGLFQDRYGVFGGDLIVVTTAGNVWRITSGGVPTKLASIDTHLEGVTTVPDDPGRFGPWSGKIVAGAENKGLIYTIDGAGSVDRFDVGIAPEDIDVITGGEDFRGIDYAGRTLWGAPSSEFAGMAGDILIAQEGGGSLWHVRWDATSGAFQPEQVATVGSWEHVTFVPTKTLAFQYAVKFVCGKSDGDVLARGTYFTAINVHNPTEMDIGFRKKFAVSLPGQKPGPVSMFFDARLGPDEAFEIDCREISERTDPKAGFVKGFCVIESDVELDVVGVYTAAGATDHVETMHLERVVPRRRPEVRLPDLVPVPDPRTGFCRRDDSPHGRLLVTVKNQGTADAPASTTTVEFSPGGSFDIPTPPIPAGQSVDLPPLDFPPACFNPDCSFRIIVDSHHTVAESDETNNVASGTCLG